MAVSKKSKDGKSRAAVNCHPIYFAVVSTTLVVSESSTDFLACFNSYVLM